MAVIGDGVVGACCALAASALGYDVLLVGRHDQKLRAVRGIAAVQTANSAGATSSLGRWAPVAIIDTVQSANAFALYADLVPPAEGEIVFSGWIPAGSQWGVDWTHVQSRELRCQFVSGLTRERILTTLELMRSGQLPIEKLISVRASDQFELTMREVASAQLSAVAVVLDWRSFASASD
ncbi:hypothetical protein [Microbacterium immunditiarum]|uniref:Threonine dehydrogenase-like Zn-dependent dehydrogenase n=1 Tax=Microbacterium immunditiarum TaxID=337480 RepID=A0A7Y9GK97_9MICO|nr:hypothetical protein [Microbacterium immunditiarum]NYE18073.1 threonine dehydrogenase-like Zn-dependent dehydrogenase [Microbacterium immunditiarum]